MTTTTFVNLLRPKYIEYNEREYNFTEYNETEYNFTEYNEIEYSLMEWNKTHDTQCTSCKDTESYHRE